MLCLCLGVLLVVVVSYEFCRHRVFILGFQAADLAEEEDAAKTQFTAVLKAGTELVTEINIVKHQSSPYY